MVTGFSLAESGLDPKKLRDLTSSADRLGAAVWLLLRLFALSIPFSIALAQTLLGVTLAVAARHWWVSGLPRMRTPLDGPILFFVVTALVAALVGLDARQSLWGLRTYLQILIVYLVAFHARLPQRALDLTRFFLFGMVITSSHTVFNTVSPWRLPNFLPGEMTESGQLLFAIGISASLLLYRVIWPRLLPFTLALHTIALIANMKRGVWLGAIALITILGLVRSRRLILVTAMLLAVTVFVAPPVRARIENTTRDLFLPGNRYDIWRASVDVIRRFPMGVGRKNGTILRDYANIPKNHKHAHNNVLQITLEDGYLGLAAYLWWMGAFGWLSWRAWRRNAGADPEAAALSIAVFSTLIGFQVAGLVEYNFGDTEVLEIFFVMMGLGVIINGKSGVLPLSSASPKNRTA